MTTQDRLCAFCVAARAGYTCPRCNRPYCALACYRSESHSACSEAFYADCCRQALEQDSVSAEERRAVLEMLQRDHDGRQEAAEEEEALEERLAGLSLDTDADQVWACLTARERADFQRLLATGEIARLLPVWTPWWTRVDPLAEEQWASVAPMSRLLPSGSAHPSVRSAVLQTLLAFVATARTTNGDLTSLHAAALLMERCPALTQPGVLAETSEAVAEVAAKLDVPATLLMLTDCLELMRHPGTAFAHVGRALREVERLLRRAEKELEAEERRKVFRARKKAQFVRSWAKERFGELRETVGELEAEWCRRAEEAAREKALTATLERQEVRRKVKERRERQLVEDVTPADEQERGK